MVWSFPLALQNTRWFQLELEQVLLKEDKISSFVCLCWSSLLGYAISPSSVFHSLSLLCSSQGIFIFTRQNLSYKLRQGQVGSLILTFILFSPRFDSFLPSVSSSNWPLMRIYMLPLFSDAVCWQQGLFQQELPIKPIDYAPIQCKPSKFRSQKFGRPVCLGPNVTFKMPFLECNFPWKQMNSKTIKLKHSIEFIGFFCILSLQQF